MTNHGTLITMKSSRTGKLVAPDHWMPGGSYSRETVERLGLVPAFPDIKPEILENKKIVQISR